MTTTADNTITFSYSLSSIFSAVSDRSAYIVKTLPTDENGKDSADRLIISSDEKEFVRTSLCEAIASLFEMFVSHSDGIENAVFSDKDGQWGFTLTIYTTFNKNRLIELDFACGEFLENFVLCQWANVLRSDVGEKVYAPALLGNARAIAEHKKEVFRKPYTKTYNLIVKDGNIL